MSGLVEKFRVQRLIKAHEPENRPRGTMELTYEPVPYPVFVLRIDGKDPAAMEALRTYAMATDNSALAADLAGIVDREGWPLYSALLPRFNLEGES